MITLSKEKRKQRRKLRNTFKIKSRNVRNLPILLVHRTENNIACQLIDNGHTLLDVSSSSPQLKSLFVNGAKPYNVLGARIMGNYIGKLINEKQIFQSEMFANRPNVRDAAVPYVCNTRDCQYHGRVKALCDAIEETRKNANR
jgi:ribosomal protein L18